MLIRFSPMKQSFSTHDIIYREMVSYFFGFIRLHTETKKDIIYSEHVNNIHVHQTLKLFNPTKRDIILITNNISFFNYKYMRTDFTKIFTIIRKCIEIHHITPNTS